MKKPNINKVFHKRWVVVMGSLFVAGLIVLSVLAAVPAVFIEPETAVLRGDVALKVDEEASNEEYVQFENVPVGEGTYDPKPYCLYHIMGSLYGDARGNGTANGVGWETPNDTWDYKAPNDRQATRFEKCAQLVGRGTVTRVDNTIQLRQFTINLSFDDPLFGPPEDLQSKVGPEAYQAFLMGLVEGEGSAKGKLDDNSKLSNGNLNPTYGRHVINIREVARRAGFTTHIIKGDFGSCPLEIDGVTNELTETQITNLLDDDTTNDTGVGGISICIDKSQLQAFGELPHASCTSRIPGTSFCTEVTDIF